ncbi:phosphonate ABC transporter ATP-binding protein [Paraliobacillus sediminis]|uniref:phosphonate ABC transporter ATP-binding protein n=1 Tax=Paraliobacillus sediminis TaxID=1885916 RepID=UPI000E3ECB25|nr:phosphonate ABC transporter ATP-binding protein [Paraliobacillus sediminis]
MLELKNLSVRYPGGEQDAISGINLSIQKGEFVCVLGQSGSGKSTFIRCINGLQKLTTGEVHWNDQQISKLNEEQLRTVRREMGMIFQHFNLVPRLSVIQNVLTGLFGYRSTFKNLIGWFTNEEVTRAKKIIADVGLADQTNRRIEQLSGGQKQRVGIARALLQEPAIFLGDEPVSSLDPGTSSHIFNLMQEMHERLGLLTIINVHDVDLARQYATRIIALKDGKIVFDDAPALFNEEAFYHTYHSETNKLALTK